MGGSGLRAMSIHCGREERNDENNQVQHSRRTRVGPQTDAGPCGCDGTLMKSIVFPEEGLGIRNVCWSPQGILAVGSYDKKVCSVAEYSVQFQILTLCFFPDSDYRGG